ncbi:hypothetical protein R2F61_03870 [Mollicutes bacterium LVI A0078]|nr:hypothetical protein RZE84_03895 [Mollicutes bacterium LVI A0075]WOO91700.1 hypothetical protein R2F61_03870 [Mollicutes bacterium LVI A0078]
MLDQRIELYLGNSEIGLDYEVYTCFYSTLQKLLKAEEYAYFKKLYENEYMDNSELDLLIAELDQIFEKIGELDVSEYYYDFKNKVERNEKIDNLIVEKKCKKLRQLFNGRSLRMAIVKSLKKLIDYAKCEHNKLRGLIRHNNLWIFIREDEPLGHFYYNLGFQGIRNCKLQPKEIKNIALDMDVFQPGAEARFYQSIGLLPSRIGNTNLTYSFYIKGDANANHFYRLKEFFTNDTDEFIGKLIADLDHKMVNMTSVQYWAVVTGLEYTDEMILKFEMLVAKYTNNIILLYDVESETTIKIGEENES